MFKDWLIDGYLPFSSFPAKLSIILTDWPAKLSIVLTDWALEQKHTRTQLLV